MIAIRARAGAAAAVLALACAGCSLIDPNNIIGRQMGEAASLPVQPVAAPASDRLDRAARERAFDFVWQTIAERYHDPAYNGVDWKAVGARYRPLALEAADDDAFWAALDRMVGELKDSHTRVESPKRVEMRKRDESITLGMSFLRLEGRFAVAAVHPESDAWWAGVRPGMYVETIDGVPAMAAYDKVRSGIRLDSTERAAHLRTVHDLVTGALGSRVAFTFERADGTRFDTVLERRRIRARPSESHRVLPSGFGYVRFTRWTIGLTLRAVEAIEELRSAPGLVIDLRGNPGGSVHAVNQMLERFFAEPADLGTATTRTGRPVSLFFGAVDIIKLKRHIEGDPKAYRGPVAILVDAASASGSELFAGTMQAAGRAVVVGQPSCGCLLGFLGYARIPGGAELAYSEVGFVLANGRRIEGEGVIPDHAVPPRVEDLRLVRDRALEEAQAVLAGLAKKREARAAAR